MAWIKVETTVARNLKFIRAGPAASWLWICGLAYCQDTLSDGFVPELVLSTIGVRSAKRSAARLVQAKLWHRVDGGWLIHDYLDHNKPATEIRRICEEKRAAGAKGGRAKGKQLAKHDAWHSANHSAKQSAKHGGTTADYPAVAVAVAVRTKDKSSPAAADDFHSPVEKPAPTPARRRQRNPDNRPTPGLLFRLAQDVLSHVQGPTDIGDIIEAAKVTCARAHIDYTTADISDAVERAIAAKKAKRAIEGLRPLVADLQTARTPEALGSKLRQMAAGARKR